MLSYPSLHQLSDMYQMHFIRFKSDVCVAREVTNHKQGMFHLPPVSLVLKKKWIVRLASATLYSFLQSHRPRSFDACTSFSHFFRVKDPHSVIYLSTRTSFLHIALPRAPPHGLIWEYSWRAKKEDESTRRKKQLCPMKCNPEKKFQKHFGIVHTTSTSGRRYYYSAQID